jgi:hypothetical protein
MRTSHEKIETHYYREKKRGLELITDEAEQRRIEEYRKRHGKNPPDGTAVESGLSAVEVPSTATLEYNESLLEEVCEGHGRTRRILRRRLDAPELPVSCIAAAEHVIATREEVPDFESEFTPPAKRKVTYQILLKLPKGISWDKADETIVSQLKKCDPTLNEKCFSLSLQPARVAAIEIGTQRGDIQVVIKALNRLNRFGYRLIDAKLSEIGLNEGLCLVKKDGDVPIHALAHIARVGAKKGFLERDAGFTSAPSTSYKDNRWTFNFYRDIAALKKENGYSADKVTAVKLFRR